MLERSSTEQIESDVAGVMNRTRSSIVVDVDRRTGDPPWRVERIGDFTMLWGTTGRIATGTSATIYLTENREPGGASLFRNEPLWSVTVDGVGDIGGVAVASGPDKPSGRYSSRHLNTSNYTASLDWAGANEVWSLTVTNSTGSTADFLFKAQGV